MSEVIGHNHYVIRKDISYPHIAKVGCGDSLDAFSIVQRVFQLNGVGDEEPARDPADDHASNHCQPLASLALTVLHVPAEELLFGALELLVVPTLNLLRQLLCHDKALFLKHRHD